MTRFQLIPITIMIIAIASCDQSNPRMLVAEQTSEGCPQDKADLAWADFMNGCRKLQTESEAELGCADSDESIWYLCTQQILNEYESAGCLAYQTPLPC